MANWCLNELTIYHPSTEIMSKFVEAFKAGNVLETFVPVPEELTAEEKHYYRISNWGVKWDIDAISVGNLSEDGQTFQSMFDTPWSPPIEAYEALLELGFTINAMFYEPGVGFCGFFEGDPETGGAYTEISIKTIEDIPHEIVEVFDLSFDEDGLDC